MVLAERGRKEIVGNGRVQEKMTGQKMIAQLIKLLAIKLDNLSLIPETHMMEEKVKDVNMIKHITYVYKSNLMKHVIF